MRRKKQKQYEVQVTTYRTNAVQPVVLHVEALDELDAKRLARFKLAVMGVEYTIDGVKDVTD